MKTLLYAAALLTLITATTAGAAASDDKPVQAQGCVQAGVEASCLVVQDISTGELYNLLINGAKPAIGTAINFTGTHYAGTTTCMQGIALQVSTWTPNTTLKCSSSKGKSVQ